MSILEYNKAEINVMATIRDEIKWNLGIELGRNPDDSIRDLREVEVRFAVWLIDGGGAWLRELPEVNREFMKIRD